MNNMVLHAFRSELGKIAASKVRKMLRAGELGTEELARLWYEDVPRDSYQSGMWLSRRRVPRPLPVAEQQTALGFTGEGPLGRARQVGAILNPGSVRLDRALSPKDTRAHDLELRDKGWAYLKNHGAPFSLPDKFVPTRSDPVHEANLWRQAAHELKWDARRAAEAVHQPKPLKVGPVWEPKNDPEFLQRQAADRAARIAHVREELHTQAAVPPKGLSTAAKVGIGAAIGVPVVGGGSLLAYKLHKARQARKAEAAQ